MQPIYPTDSINFMFSPLPSRGKHILHTADPSMLEPDQNDPVAYGDQRASGKPLGFWKSDRVPCLPPMVTDITVQHSAVSSLLQKRKGVSLSLLPMSLSLHVGPAMRSSVTALSERSQQRDDHELESLVSAPMLTTPANIRIMCDLGVHPAAVSVDELVECDNGQDETAREEDVFCLRSLLAATPSLGSLREAREEDAMAAADEREGDGGQGARKRCRTGRSSCFSFETGDIHTDLGLGRKHALSMSFAKSRVQATATSFRYDHGYSHDLDRNGMDGLPETEAEAETDGSTDCSSVSSCDTDVASSSSSESPLSQFGALEGAPSLSYSSSESSFATTSSECSASTAPSEISLSNLSLTSKHSRRESVACTRAQWATSMQPRALGNREADDELDEEEDEMEGGGVDAMFEYDRGGLAPQNEITNHLARFLR
mmetsp:Transcript_60689/g.166660  ORF Transcript_60689/g.166660 Transcript_60689/m.166660 type:complete len:430 (+) Transcript_60689:45-1334(+)